MFPRSATKELRRHEHYKYLTIERVSNQIVMKVQARTGTALRNQESIEGFFLLTQEMSFQLFLEYGRDSSVQLGISFCQQGT